MTMLDRDHRRADADEETVRLARKDFARRRRLQRLRRGRPLLLVVLALVLVAGGVWLVYFSSAVTAQRVSVVGTQRISSARVARIAQVPVGTPLAQVDLGAIERRVGTIPAVRSVDVSRSWPHTVQVSVTERVPVAVVDRGNGLQALDSSGVVFLHYRQRPPGLPLVHTTGNARRDALAEAGKVASALPPALARRVDYVEVATVDQIRLVLTHGPAVLWGSSAESDRKAEVLAVMLRHKVSQIDVSVPERPTTRP
jgi:cell division protein FtsQ